MGVYLWPTTLFFFTHQKYSEAYTILFQTASLQAIRLAWKLRCEKIHQKKPNKTPHNKLIATKHLAHKALSYWTRKNDTERRYRAFVNHRLQPLERVPLRRFSPQFPPPGCFSIGIFPPWCPSRGHVHMTRRLDRCLKAPVRWGRRVRVWVCEKRAQWSSDLPRFAYGVFYGARSRKWGFLRSPLRIKGRFHTYNRKPFLPRVEFILRDALR